MLYFRSRTRTQTLTVFMTSNWHTVIWVCVSCFVCSTGDSQAKEPCKRYQRGGQGGKTIHGRLGRNWASITGMCCLCWCAELETQAFKFLRDARFYSSAPFLTFHQNEYLSSFVLRYSHAYNGRPLKEFEHATSHMAAKTSPFTKFRHPYIQMLCLWTARVICQVLKHIFSSFRLKTEEREWRKEHI